MKRSRKLFRKQKLEHNFTWIGLKFKKKKKERNDTISLKQYLHTSFSRSWANSQKLKIDLADPRKVQKPLKPLVTFSSQSIVTKKPVEQKSKWKKNWFRKHMKGTYVICWDKAQCPVEMQEKQTKWPLESISVVGNKIKCNS